jgi:hypothetical protein
MAIASPPAFSTSPVNQSRICASKLKREMGAVQVMLGQDPPPIALGTHR